LLVTIDSEDFDELKKKSKDYYTVIKNSKAKLPNNSQHLRKTFNLSEDHLKKIFQLLHKVTFEQYIKAFQYKVLTQYYLLIQSYLRWVTSQRINVQFVTQNQ